MPLADPSAGASKRSMRVLVVDDEHTVADTLALILNRSGYDSRAVYTGLEALDAMPVFRPDVVLSDVMMPGLDGFDPAFHISENFSPCKVLLMSGMERAFEMAEENVAKGRVINVLTKPVRPQAILEFMSRCSGELNACQV